MSISTDTVAHVLQQLEPLNARARAMFGEYGIYVDDKIAMLVRDDTVFLKPAHKKPAPRSPSNGGVPPAQCGACDVGERIRAFARARLD